MVSRRTHFAHAETIRAAFLFCRKRRTPDKKSELLDAVWDDTYVEETTLARNVSWLRKKLEKCRGGENLIETVPKLGYRFTAEITRSADEENALIVEEQIIQYVRGEEIITIDNAAGVKTQIPESAESNLAVLPHPALSPRRSVALTSVLFIAILSAALAGTGFVIYQRYIKAPVTSAIVASRVAPFTGAAGNENNPAFSPDGRQLAYSWKRGEEINGDIYIKLIGAGEPLRLTKTEANEQYPTFSPDGKHIAFIRGKYGEPGEVIIIPALGGTERSVAKLFSGNYSISFSPDGQSIAVIDTENSTEGGQFAVYTINIETGERRRVTAPAEFVGETTPRFSPDGKSLAFIRIAKENPNIPDFGNQDLFVVPVGGGEPRQITSDGLIINSLAWGADGEHIYFVPLIPPNQTLVRRVSAGGGGKLEIVATGGTDITNIAVSPDGKKLVFAEEIQQWSIWSVPPDGRTGNKLVESNASELFPQFSPDNSHIAFQSDRSGTYQIWTADADGKNLRQITDTPFPSTAPRFSPDGSLIAFNQKNGEDFANYTIPAAGGAARRISPESAQEDFPVWSADGKYIYFSSTRAGKRNIWKMNADGSGEARQITTIGAYRGTPTFDGKTVYFTKTDFPMNSGASRQTAARKNSCRNLPLPDFITLGS